ncbi:hypothetical protein [Rhizobium sp. AAP116]|uniref:hypothetical protein n=1 Tax=Rhizobium sp. AAP116 TaxID=1523429 RepID=UPI0006B9D78A|nr:hypothetical protein [Rhizobium sp. AAP116]
MTMLAILATLVFSFVPQSSHPLIEHASAQSMLDHGHDHGDHSHDDDLDFSVNTADTDHHHADHTHEKAGLVSASRPKRPAGRHSAFILIDTTRDDGRLYGIDRPPRFVNIV